MLGCLVLGSCPLAPSAYFCFRVISGNCTRPGKEKRKQNEYEGRNTGRCVGVHNTRFTGEAWLVNDV